MFTHYRTLGIVLDKRERGEADQVFSVFTEDFGLIEVRGRAIRKIASKLRAGIEVFYLSEIEFIEGKAYKTLTDAVVRKKFLPRHLFLQNGSLAWRLAELAKGMLGPQEERMVFAFLEQSFESLGAPIPREKQLPFLLFFLWNLIALAGYAPECARCVRCGRVAREVQGFALREGGVVCKSCFPRIPKQDKIPIGLGTAKLINFFLSRPWREVEKVRLAGAHLRELKKVSFKYFKVLYPSHTKEDSL